MTQKPTGRRAQCCTNCDVCFLCHVNCILIIPFVLGCCCMKASCPVLDWFWWDNSFFPSFLHDQMSHSHVSCNLTSVRWHLSSLCFSLFHSNLKKERSVLMRMRKLCHSHSACVCKTRYPPEAKLKVRIENPVITRSSNRNLRLFRCRTSSSSNSKKSISSQHFFIFIFVHFLTLPE